MFGKKNVPVPLSAKMSATVAELNGDRESLRDEMGSAVSLFRVAVQRLEKVIANNVNQIQLIEDTQSQLNSIKSAYQEDKEYAERVKAKMEDILK